MQVGTKEWPFRSNQGMVPSTQAEYRLIPPADHKLMRTRWISFHEQNWVHSCERRGVGVPYGSRARLIILYLQSEALKTQSREVELGKTLHAWLTLFDH